MALKTNKNEPQFQMSDYLFSNIVYYLKSNNIKFQTFCNEVNLPKYYLRKIMDRKIKMHSYPSLFIRLAKHCNIPSDSTHRYYVQSTTRKG